jgi:hypothetical protein
MRLVVSTNKTRHRLFKFLKKDPVQIIEEVGTASRLEKWSDIKRIAQELNEELCQAIAQDPVCASTVFNDLSWRQYTTWLTKAADLTTDDVPVSKEEQDYEAERWEHFLQCESIVTHFRIDRGRHQMIICNKCSGKSFTKANPKRMVFKARSRVLRDIVGINLSEFEGLQESLSDKPEWVAKSLSSRFHDVIRSDPEGSGRQLFKALYPMFTNSCRSAWKRHRDSAELSATLPGNTTETPVVDGSPSSSMGGPQDMDYHGDDVSAQEQAHQQQVQQAQQHAQQVQQQQAQQEAQQQVQQVQQHHDEEDMVIYLPEADSSQQSHEQQQMLLLTPVPQTSPQEQQGPESSTISASTISASTISATNTAMVERVLRTIDASGRGQILVARLKLDDCCSLLLLENPLPSRTHEMVQQHLYSLLCGSDIGALTHVLHRFSDHKSCIENIVSRLGEEQCLGLLLSETNPLPNATLNLIEDHLYDTYM